MSPDSAKKFLEAAQTILQAGEKTKGTQAQDQYQDFRPQGVEGGVSAPQRAPIQDGIRRGGTLQDLAPYEEGDEIIPVMPGENLMDAYERLDREGRAPQSVNAPLGQVQGTQFDQIEQAPSQSIQMPEIGLEGVYGPGRPSQPTEENLDQLMKDIEDLPDSSVEGGEKEEPAPERRKQLADSLFGGEEGEKQRAERRQADLESYERLTAPSELMKQTYTMPRSAGVSMENLMNQARKVIPASRR